MECGVVGGADFYLLEAGVVARGDFFRSEESLGGEAVARGMERGFDGHDADGAATEEPDGQAREEPDGGAAKEGHLEITIAGDSWFRE